MYTHTNPRMALDVFWKRTKNPLIHADRHIELCSDMHETSQEVLREMINSGELRGMDMQLASQLTPGLRRGSGAQHLGPCTHEALNGILPQGWGCTSYNPY